MIEAKRFSGVLNTDDLPENVLGPQHIDAKNIRFYGGQNGLTAENIKGNYQIDNNDLPAGNNQCVGTFFDVLNQRIIWFNYNSNGDNGIYSLDIGTEVVTPIFICGTDSATDILNFNLDYPVHSASIVYRGTSAGDLLYWTDGYNRPKYLNLNTVSTLAPFTEAMLFAGKLPPLGPPDCGYANDAAIDYNNVYNRYFRFAYRWVYENGEKSTFSPTSIMPTTQVQDPQNPIAPNTYNYILINNIISPSTNDFKSIEVYGQEYNGASWGDFFLITELARVAGGLPQSYSFNFYNDGVYAPITGEESDLRWDYLPDKANTLELLNGNVLIYGGITEGRNNIAREDIDVQITTSLTTTFIIPEAFRWGQTERFGLIYFDQFGKTNGVISYLNNATDTTNFDVTTLPYPGSVTGYPPIPKISASINHTPPTWATSYQWVRLDAAPQFLLQWVTNDFQDPLDGFLYLGVENLNYANEKDGLIPSYEFQPGDRVKILGYYTGTLTVTAYLNQYDFQIIDGNITRTMTAPNTITNGRYIKIPKIAGLPAYLPNKNLLIEIYTPAPNVTTEDAIFYEWGEKYDIYESGGNRYHTGQVQNQTASQPATFEWTNGYLYINTNVPFYIMSTTPSRMFAAVMTRFRNVFQNSKANSNSRGWPIDVNASEEYLPTLVRWGGAYVQNTNVNNLNRFYPQDQDTIDRAKGDIRRFKARDRILRVFQDRGCGQYGVYARFIQNNQGQSELVTTNTIITTNNIQYYAGVYGLCGYPTNLVSTQNADYFTDVVTGRCVRLGRDGLTDLGLLYKGQYFLSTLATPYNKTITRPDGTKSKVMGFFDYFENQYHVVLQGDLGTLEIISQGILDTGLQYDLYLGGVSGAGDTIYLTITDSQGHTESFTYISPGNETAQQFLTGLSLEFGTSVYFSATVVATSPYPRIEVISSVAASLTSASATLAEVGANQPQNYSFNETRNAFCSFYDYHPEWATGANDMVYSWLDGVLYKHNNTTNYCNFYGEQYNASVIIVFNPAIHVKKSWNSLMEIADTIWIVPTMYTNTYSYGTTKQQSSLVEAEFQLLEGNPSAAIKRDANSSGGKINGNFMKGNWLVVKFQKTNANNLVNLSEVSARFTDSPLTVK